MAADNVLFYLGPPGTYSHEAASALASRKGASFELWPSDSITSCLSDAKAHSTFALLPLENSTYGTVTETISVLIGLGKEATIVSEVVRPVKHALLASRQTAKRLDEFHAASNSTSESRLRFLEVIYSHEQALGQCSAFLKRTCPDAAPTPAASTALGVKLAQEAPSSAKLSAGIGSSYCASVMDVVVLQDGIQDKNNNETRFILICFWSFPPSSFLAPGPARALIRLTCTTSSSAKSRGALQSALNQLYSTTATIRKVDRRALPLEETTQTGKAAAKQRSCPSVYLIEVQDDSVLGLRSISSKMCEEAQASGAIEAVVLGVWNV